eukprot:jgi/Ulvmu1/10778/UM069_0012.1
MGYHWVDCLVSQRLWCGLKKCSELPGVGWADDGVHGGQGSDTRLLRVADAWACVLCVADVGARLSCNGTGRDGHAQVTRIHSQLLAKALVVGVGVHMCGRWVGGTVGLLGCGENARGRCKGAGGDTLVSI